MINYKKFFCFSVILFALVFFGQSLPSFAENETPAAVTPTETGIVSEAPAAPVEAPTIVESVSSPGNVTIDFKDADIQNVLRILSFKSGVNIVAGKDVTGTVTLRLVDVPWEKALDIVLKTNGYAYDRDDNIIRVATLESLKKEELSTEVYVLNYSDAKEVEPSLKDILSERGKVRSDSRSNSLIVTDMPTTLFRVSKVIHRLDKQTPQVVIQAKVIETILGDSEKLGIKWNIHAAANGSSRPNTFPFPALSTVAKPLRNFLPEGRGSVSTTSAATSSTTATTTTSDFPSPDNAHQPTFPLADKDEFVFGTLDFTQFQAILQMINSRTNAKILSEPHVTTLNNKQAKILVGEVIAIPTFERNATTGRMEITGYTDRDLGIRLAVTPQINEAGEIVVTIHPEVTSLVGYDELTTEIKAPRFSTREAETQVRIKNGQTIAIGGLIREDSVDTVTKVPILGDLPLISKFFSHTDKTVQKTDLLFFMTVNIVDDQSPALQGHRV